MLESKIKPPPPPYPSESCCTCARLLPDFPLTDIKSSDRFQDAQNEKPVPSEKDRRLPCCGRIICGRCISGNARFRRYCPFCQISTDDAESRNGGTSTIPKEGLRDPPSYERALGDRTVHARNGEKSSDSTRTDDDSEDDRPPAYSATSPQSKPTERDEKGDLIHHLHHPDDTLPSLALRYNVPLPILRRHNNLSSDHLLAARRTLSIPRAYYTGPSLSPTADESDEEARKRMLRRFMVQCKVSEYDVAKLYLEQCGYDLEKAVEMWREEERWEREHPMKVEGKGKGKHDVQAVGRRRFLGRK